MRLLFISYWGVNEGLTASAVIPYLKYLNAKMEVKKIIFSTFERKVDTYPDLNLSKIEHHPFQSKNIKYSAFTKVRDFGLYKKYLLKLSKDNDINIVYCKGAMAGLFGHFLLKKLSIKYIVDSFEPHADYMLEAGTWKRYGLRYITQKRWEAKQMKSASFLITVSNLYKKQLIKSGVNQSKLEVIPTCVNLEDFKYEPKYRTQIRNKLNIDGKKVGIYVGKFGDIYYDEEAFLLFKELFHIINDFYLIILTPHDSKSINEKLKKIEINLENTFVDLVPFSDVPKYLSASDFSISTIKPTSSRKYCSPIKHGEYWANGLPLLFSIGLGDDSQIMHQYNLGTEYDIKNDFKSKISEIKHHLNNEERINVENKYVNIAEKYRSFDMAFSILNSVFEKLKLR